MISSLRKSAILVVLPTLTACAARFIQENRGSPRAAVVKDGPASIDSPHHETPRIANPEESNEMIAFEVYRRGGRYFVTVWASGSEVTAVTIPDLIPVDPTAESIAAAFGQLEPPIRNALAQVQRGKRHPEEESEENEEKQWRQMGAKSYRQFLRTASYCSVWKSEERTIVFFMKLSPVTGAFAGKPEPDARLDPDASYEDIARAVLEIFAKNPPPPDDKPDPPPKRPRKSAPAKQ